MTTLISAGKAGNRIETHFCVAEPGSSVPEKESDMYQPTRRELWMFLGLLMAGAGMFLLAAWKAWELACAIGSKLGGLL